jgi:hypothetical protein
MFALPVLAAKRMLEAGGKPDKRGEYSLELLELMSAPALSRTENTSGSSACAAFIKAVRPSLF